MSIDNIEDYAAMSPEEIDLRLGDALLKGTLGSKSMSDSEKRKVAHNWFQANMPTFAKAVCTEGNIVNYVTGPQRKERNELIVSLSDALLKAAGVSFAVTPVALVAVKIWNHGIDQLCEGDASEGT